MWCVKKIIRSLVYLIAIFLTSGVITSSFVRAEEQVTLQLKWLHQFQFAGYYAAQEKGFYRDAGFNVEFKELDLFVPPIDVVLNGGADFGVADSSLILQRMIGQPVVILGAIFQHSPLVLLTRANDGLLGPYELKGKRVMYQPGIDGAALTGMFHELGISEDELVHVPHSFDNYALLSKDIDAMVAYSTDQPYLYAQKNVNVHAIDPLNYGIDFYGDMLFASEESVRRDPQRVQRFLKATIQGWQYALKNPEEVIGWIKSKYGSRKSVGSLRYEAEQTAKMILPQWVEIGYTSSSRFQRIAGIYKQLDLAPESASFAGVTLQEYQGDQRSIPLWFKGVLVTTGILLFIALALFVLARHLRVLVRERTNELDKANADVARYMEIVDQQVISSQTDKYGVITNVSKAFCESSGYSESELVGMPHSVVRHVDTDPEVFQRMWETLKISNSWTGISKNVAKTGDDYWLEYHIDPVMDDSGNVVGYVSIGQDISDKKRIELLSITDKLTGLYNRDHLDKVFEQELERLRRYDGEFSIILCDVDNFKTVNDTYGHVIGDNVLANIASLLNYNCRNLDVVGRWGGEELLIICPATSLDGAKQMAEKLRQEIADFYFCDVGNVYASFGVAAADKDFTADELVNAADTALYRAKNNGRNWVEIFDVSDECRQAVSVDKFS